MTVEELKSRFISSNEYGLDSYLSVRVRHGTLSGQIRSHFETENLITRKSVKQNDYATNAYWTDRVQREDMREVIDECLKTFSQQVDDAIEHVNSALIQIKAKDKREGLFDYNYSQNELIRIWISLFVRDIPIDYDEFQSIVLSELWARTEANLQHVRYYIRNDLKVCLTEILDELSAKVSGLRIQNEVSLLITSVVRCRTHIQNELEAIAEWFRITEDKTFSDFQLEQLTDTTLEMVRKYYPSIHFAPNIHVKSNVCIHGTMFESFADIMFILLENMAKHSNTELDAEVFIETDSNFLTIRLSNNIAGNIDIVEAKERVTLLRRPEIENALMQLTRKEGGSGYYKLHKIIKHDLACDEYEVEFNIDEDLDLRLFKATVKVTLKGIAS